MKNNRAGEHLWHEWDGELFESGSPEPTVYYTYGVIDSDIELVKRALASALQRDGIADSLGLGFSMIDKSKTTYGWVGSEENGRSLIVCDENGETCYGDILYDVSRVTFVEFE
jgi:hypothetical protein